MAPKPIQEQFGQAVIDTFAKFAIADLQKPNVIGYNHLSHISDATMRARLAEVWYGARWIYKLGLALLVKDAEQVAHVRAQIIDYAAVCEGIIFDMLDDAILKGHLKGKRYQFKDVNRLRYPVAWTPGRHRLELERMTFFWLISVAEEERIVGPTTGRKLHWLRDQRNHVHVRPGTHAAYLNKSRDAFNVVIKTVTDTKRWKRMHP